MYKYWEDVFHITHPPPPPNHYGLDSSLNFTFYRWPAFITPDPNCDEYYDAVLNDNDEQEEITHIHVEFFGQPRTHAWIKTEHAFPYSGSRSLTVKSKWKRSYNLAMEDAIKSLPLTCEERLEKCAFRYLVTSDTKEG